MTRKNYIFNLKNLIKNRVKYHAPIKYDGDVDYEKILEKGIDLSLPVFIMEKPIKKEILKAFCLAEKEVPFNLVLREENKHLMKKFKRCFVVKEEEIPSIKKLDINYKSFSTYNLKEEGNFLKVGERLDDFQEKMFFYEKKGIFQGVYFVVKKYLLSGENFQIDLTNTNPKESVLKMEYNRELPRGYYLFEKVKTGLKISNLLREEVQFLNANFGHVSENFSCVDGVENSSFAKINLSVDIHLKPFEKRSFFINFGSKPFSVSNRSEMDFFFGLSQRKNFEIFDIKVDSENKYFERTFNRILPFRIWRAWLKGERDPESEDKYIQLKNKILLKKGKKSILRANNFKIKSLYEFDGKEYRKIAVES